MGEGRASDARLVWDQIRYQNRSFWRTPIAATAAVLRRACRARLKRVPQLSRRRRLERIQRRIDAAYQLARTRAWIEDFIGPPAEPGKAGG